MASGRLLWAILAIALGSCTRQPTGIPQQISLAVDVSQWNRFPTDETTQTWSEIDWEKRHAWVRQAIGANRRANWRDEYITASEIRNGHITLVARQKCGEQTPIGCLKDGVFEFALLPGEWNLITKNELTGGLATLLTFDVDAKRTGRHGFLRIGPGTEKSLLWMP